MVWAAISANMCSRLVLVQGNLTARRYVDDVLRPHLIPFKNQHVQPMTFQQDNAPAHRAIATRDFLQAANVQVMNPWPAQSPDLNPIEHMWDRLERELRKLPVPRTLNQLEQGLQVAWNNIPQEFIRRSLIRSMRRRCIAVQDADGGHTRY